MELLGKVVFGLVVIVISAIVRGLAVSVLWNWFLPTIGISHISVAQALGIFLVVHYLTYDERLKEDPDYKKAGTIERLIIASLSILANAIAAILCGWGAAQFL